MPEFEDAHLLVRYLVRLYSAKPYVCTMYKHAEENVYPSNVSRDVDMQRDLCKHVSCKIHSNDEEM